MDQFVHIRMLMGTILALSIAQVLKGSVKFIEHPDKHKPYSVHLLWGFYLFILILHFWWWQFGLRNIAHWEFVEYFYEVLYSVFFFIIATLLFPDQIQDYKGYEDYFLSRRKWLFSILAFVYLMDIVDTRMKGEDYFHSFGIEYDVLTGFRLLGCVVGFTSSNQRLHKILVTLFILSQMFWIVRYNWLLVK